MSTRQLAYFVLLYRLSYHFWRREIDMTRCPICNSLNGRGCRFAHSKPGQRRQTACLRQQILDEEAGRKAAAAKQAKAEARAAARLARAAEREASLRKPPQAQEPTTPSLYCPECGAVYDLGRFGDTRRVEFCFCCSRSVDLSRKRPATPIEV